MKYEDIFFGGVYIINGREERCVNISRRGKSWMLNGVDAAYVSPVILTEKVFDEYGFKYYNGYYHPIDENKRSQILLFIRDKNGYIVSLGGNDINNLTIKYLHELQRIYITLKVELL